GVDAILSLEAGQTGKVSTFKLTDGTEGFDLTSDNAASSTELTLQPLSVSDAVVSVVSGAGKVSTFKLSDDSGGFQLVSDNNGAGPTELTVQALTGVDAIVSVVSGQAGKDSTVQLTDGAVGYELIHSAGTGVLSLQALTGVDAFVS